MSVTKNMIRLDDAAEFSWGVGEFIALEVAKGASVRRLHEAFPDEVPNPIIVNRWRKRVPAFDLLMREAEEAKAEYLADEILELADDEGRQAAQARNAMEARKWLAGKLSADRFGSGGGQRNGVESHGVNLILTDEQLMAIASRALTDPSVVEGESERREEGD